MEKIYLNLLALILFSTAAMGQVGLRTMEPTADLEIVSNPTPGVDNYNGIIIPKVLSLPITGTDAFPKPAQAGLLIYLDSGIPATQGIYMFNGTSYVRLESGAASGAFYNNGTTTFTNTTTMNIQRSGNVSIGGPLNSGKLNSQILSTEPATTAPKTGFRIDNSNKSAADEATYGIFTENNSRTTNNKVGIRTDVSSDGDGNHIGISNNVTDNITTAGGSVIGIENKIGDVGGTAAGIENYGIKSTIGVAGSSGPIYGIYSEANGSTANKVYAGLFNGKLGTGDVARTKGFDFPTDRGTVGQVLTTDGAGISTWSNPASASQIAFYNSGGSNAASSTTGTIYRTGRLSVGEDRFDRQLNVTSPALASSALTTLGSRNLNTSTAGVTYAGNFLNDSSTASEKIGILTEVSGSGSGNHIGLDVIVKDAPGVTTNYGIRSDVGATSNVTSTSYGIYSKIGTGASSGTNYAIYAFSEHAASTSDPSYSGYFRGDNFAIRSEDDLNGYNLPTIDGTAGQVLTTNGAKVASWQNPSARPTTSARLGLNSSQNITSVNSWEKLNFSSVEFNDGSAFNTSTNRFQAVETGIYFVNAQFHSANPHVDDRTVGIAIYKNNILYAQYFLNHHANGQVYRNISSTLKLLATDYIEVFFISSITPFIADSNTSKTFFEVTKM